jgi:translation initiation factor 2B subunit (eIF-2B alpha/beta/delta family)
VMKLKRRQLSGRDMAVETAEVLVKVIGAAKGNNPNLLITEVQDIGRRLEEAGGTGELIVGNICRRVLFIIRDEYATLIQASKAAESEDSAKAVTARHPSLGDVLEGDLALPGANRVWTDDVPQHFKSVVVESIKELVKEIESIKEHVADQVSKP